MKGLIVIGTVLTIIVGALNYFAEDGKAAIINAGNTYHAKLQTIK